MSTFSPLKILVIEDDEDAGKGMRDILEIDGHQIELAVSGQDGLSKAAAAPFDAILLDRRLPDISADDLLPRLRSTAPQADAIVITGHADLDSAIAALRLGATDYLLKPVSFESLRNRLGQIAERRWLSREMKRSEAAFQKLIEAAPCMIVILKQDGSVAYVSRFTEDLTGFEARELLERDGVEALFSEEDRATARKELQQVLAGAPTLGRESRLTRRDGSTLWIVWNAHRLDDFQGAPAALIAGQDITQQKTAVERLVQAERLAAIGEAMTGLAHESRNALQRSQAGLELLARQISDRPESLKLLARLQNAQDELHQLYEGVREYAAPLRLRKEPCDLLQLLRQIWDDLKPVREARSARLQCPEQSAVAVCDADRFAIRQVFRNILENALAACPDPVVIDISCRTALCGGLPGLEVTVRDNGPGLTAEQRRRIFEPFYTTKTHGTGLGMAICNRIVQAHGGQIAVAVASGPGAAIVVTLPLHAP